MATARHARQAQRHDDGETLVVFDRAYRVQVAVGDPLTKMSLAPDEVRGRLLPEILSPSEWALVCGPLQAALDGQPSQFERELQGVQYSIDIDPLTENGETVGGVARTRSLTEEHRLASVITAQEASARDAARLLATAFDRTPIAMSIVDLDGGWLRVNDAYCQLLGYERDELLTLDSRELTHPDDAAEHLEWARRAARGDVDTLERAERCLSRDGRTIWVDLRAEMLPDDSGASMCIVSLMQDTTDRRTADQALKASERYLRAIVDNTPEPMFAQGLDRRYQMVNLAFTEAVGLPRSEILGRRDDELLPAAAAATNAASFHHALRTGDLVQQEDDLEIDGEVRTYVTVKFPLRDAENEIYAICGTFNDITARKRDESNLRNRLAWADRIHEAVDRGRLVLHGQPIIDLASGEVEQAELLVRMRPKDGSRELIPPGEFIPQAERFGAIHTIDRWVLAESLKVAMDHRVEINLSGATISDARLVTEIESAVRESGAPPENIIFEITESAVAENIESAREFTKRLHGLGCRFALDDFGIGFGAFTYLKHLPVDYLKIDIGFVRDLVDNDDSRQVVHAILSVARDFAIKTIAEGVEDQATLDLLALMGADYAQGYWIGRPVPLEELWPTPIQTRTR